MEFITCPSVHLFFRAVDFIPPFVRHTRTFLRYSNVSSLNIPAPMSSYNKRYHKYCNKKVCYCICVTFSKQFQAQSIEIIVWSLSRDGRYGCKINCKKPQFLTQWYIFVNQQTMTGIGMKSVWIGVGSIHARTHRNLTKGFFTLFSWSATNRMSPIRMVHDDNQKELNKVEKVTVFLHVWRKCGNGTGTEERLVSEIVFKSFFIKFIPFLYYFALYYIFAEHPTNALINMFGIKQINSGGRSPLNFY